MENNGENPKALGMVDPVEPEEIIDPPTDAHCPSCNGPALRKGKTILCQICDCSFRYTKEGPKVAEIGPFDKLEARVAKLEGGDVVEPKVVLPPISVREDAAEAAEEAERQAAEAASEAEREAAEQARAESADNGI